MTEVNLELLLTRLNAICKDSLETAIKLCVDQAHQTITIEHWLISLLSNKHTAFAASMKYYKIDANTLEDQLYSNIQKLTLTKLVVPHFAANLISFIQDLWLFASLEDESTIIHSGHIFYTLTKQQKLLQKINCQNFSELMAVIRNDADCTELQSAKTIEGSINNVNISQATDLERYTVDLVALSLDGKIDRAIGRDQEIEQMINILCRRRQNNPILTGEAGVGKTAIVEELAFRIANNQVPEVLRNVSLKSLDLALLKAGASVKGELEKRLKNIIQQIERSATTVILFLDEAHCLMNGGQQGPEDIANIIKPALARGELKMIAATTWKEYKKYFEKDEALTRRFQVIKVAEPSEEQAIAMLRKMKPALEKHHKVIILEEAIVDAVRISKRYLPERKLPDKAVSVLDTAAAKVKLSQTTTPFILQLQEENLNKITEEILCLSQEEKLFDKKSKKIKILKQQQRTLEDSIKNLYNKWQTEQSSINKLQKLETILVNNTTQLELKQEYNNKLEKLNAYQQKEPLVHYMVDAKMVASIISGWTGIPLGEMLKDEANKILNLAEHLKQRIHGQDHAIEKIVNSIQISRAKLNSPSQPIGVFLLVGPSGVGKTETALSLAEAIYGNEKHLTVINLSEYKEPYKVSQLIGSPPGYVGYGSGGILTEAVRKRPYSVILLDEIEKAHPSIQELFYQVFDKGVLVDSEGCEVDFSNTIIILTSNVAANEIIKICENWKDFEEQQLHLDEHIKNLIQPALLNVFKSAFIGRVNIIPYLSLDGETLKTITQGLLDKLVYQIKQNYNINLNLTGNIIEKSINKELIKEIGVRHIKNLINQLILPRLAKAFLQSMSANKKINQNVCFDFLLDMEEYNGKRN